MALLFGPIDSNSHSLTGSIRESSFKGEESRENSKCWCNPLTSSIFVKSERSDGMQGLVAITH